MPTSGSSSHVKHASFFLITIKSTLSKQHDYGTYYKLYCLWVTFIFKQTRFFVLFKASRPRTRWPEVRQPCSLPNGTSQSAGLPQDNVSPSGKLASASRLRGFKRCGVNHTLTSYTTGIFGREVKPRSISLEIEILQARRVVSRDDRSTSGEQDREDWQEDSSKFGERDQGPGRVALAGEPDTIAREGLATRSNQKFHAALPNSWEGMAARGGKITEVLFAWIAVLGKSQGSYSFLDPEREDLEEVVMIGRVDYVIEQAQLGSEPRTPEFVYHDCADDTASDDNTVGQHPDSSTTTPPLTTATTSSSSTLPPSTSSSVPTSSSSSSIFVPPSTSSSSSLVVTTPSTSRDTQTTVHQTSLVATIIITQSNGQQLTSTSTVLASPSSSTAAASTTAASSSSSHTGAIVGRTIGGIAGLAIVGALIWFLYKRNCSNRLSAHFDGNFDPDPIVARPPDVGLNLDNERDNDGMGGRMGGRLGGADIGAGAPAHRLLLPQCLSIPASLPGILLLYSTRGMSAKEHEARQNQLGVVNPDDRTAYLANGPTSVVQY
ncbi:hypothetical protein EDD85DRAFT_945426 [Armillaria nabsnona]|nr:hypothetical protein EDD85DRAFT_945426 [Armillaria nabsnona]